MTQPLLEYEILGPSGAPPVLLSAGLGGLATYWRPQLDAFARDFRVILYDQRGTGRNAQPLPDGHSIADMADDIAAIIAACGCGPCHVMGHALGGLIGLDLALRHRPSVRSLVVVNAWARPDTHTARCFAIRKDILAHGGPAAYARAQPVFLYPSAWLSANPDRVAAEEAHGIKSFQGEHTLLTRIAALSRFDIMDQLHQLDVPTLVLAARDDVLVPFTCSEILARGIPGATLTVLSGGGHACNITEAAAFDRIATAFLHRQQAGMAPL
jgi:aminoacrylate hydrolase